MAIEVYRRTPERDKILGVIPRRNHVTSQPGQAIAPQKRARAASYEYTGYFKLVLESQPVSDEPGANVDYYVNIVDGATYDAEQNPVSGKSVCKVNNVTYQLAQIYGSGGSRSGRGNRSGTGKSRNRQFGGGRQELSALRHLRKLLVSARQGDCFRKRRRHAQCDDTAGSSGDGNQRHTADLVVWLMRGLKS